jgi:diguanylate cyclase (GGDEF)-like protein
MPPEFQNPINLGHRLDTLSIALKNLEGDPETEAAARRLLGSIRASSALHGLDPVAVAARRAETAPAPELPLRMRDLISLLRMEIVRQNIEPQTILVVSGDDAMTAGLKTSLEARGRRVIMAGTPSAALQAIAGRRVAFVIIDLVLPGQDGRALVTELRSRPATAALPIVVIGPAKSLPEKQRKVVNEADGYFPKPANPDEVADYLILHLKRGHEVGREARRDPATGLLNRAGFCEAFARAQEQTAAREPSALAILGINQFESLAQGCGPVAQDALISQIGSILSSSFRSTDTLARWDASEFIVLLPGEDHYGATRALEKVIAALNRQRVMSPSGKKLPVTICAGLVILTEKMTVESAASNAERFLYAAFHSVATENPGTWILSDATQVGRRSEHVALCLNDEKMARTVKQLLERDTFTAHVFPTPAALLAELKTKRFHLLITDDEWPDGGGFDIMERAKDIPRQNRMKMVMIVGHEASIEKAMALGASDYIVKPFPVTAFMTRLRRVLWHGERGRGTPTISILVVDHELPQLLVAGTTLHQHGGCRLFLAKGAKDALRRLAEIHPNYLILDLHMPEMGGQAFLDAIPATPRIKGLEIIPALSAGAPAPALKSPVFTVRKPITRPFQPRTFVQELSAIIPACQNENAAGAPADPKPLEAEIQRLLGPAP